MKRGGKVSKRKSKSTCGWLRGIEEEDKGGKRGGLTEAKEERERQNGCLLISHFPQRR